MERFHHPGKETESQKIWPPFKKWRKTKNEIHLIYHYYILFTIVKVKRLEEIIYLRKKLSFCWKEFSL